MKLSGKDFAGQEGHRWERRGLPGHCERGQRGAGSPVRDLDGSAHRRLLRRPCPAARGLGADLREWQAGHIHGEDDCAGCDFRGPGGHDYAQRMAQVRRELPDYPKWFDREVFDARLAEAGYELEKQTGGCVTGPNARARPGSLTATAGERISLGAAAEDAAR